MTFGQDWTRKILTKYQYFSSHRRKNACRQSRSNNGPIRSALKSPFVHEIGLYLYITV